MSRGTGTRTDVGGGERRVVDRRHELGREEGAHDLADRVGADDAGDAQPVRELRRQGALADTGGAADEDDQRRLECASVCRCRKRAMRPSPSSVPSVAQAASRSPAKVTVVPASLNIRSKAAATA